MLVNNCYYHFKSVLDNETCDKIISLGLSKQILNAATRGNQEKFSKKNAISIEDKTIQEINKNNQDYYVRDSEISWLTDSWLYDLILPFLIMANEKAGWKYNIDSFESFQFTKYNSPGGFYGWHNDGAGDHLSVFKRFIPGIHKYNKSGNVLSGYVIDNRLVNKVRKISMTINLSTENSYEGGNLKFDFGPHSEKERFYECLEIRPRGSIIVFPSHIYHQVTPVTKGTRYSLVLWACGRPFK